jgi:transcriptional regulator, cro/CI family
MIDKNILSNLYPDLSYNIRSLRKKSKLTQKELADKANISFRTIQNYENGLTPPSIKTIEKIASALGVSVERLISKYVFDNNATASDILEKMTLDLEFKEKINNLILTDIIFEIVDLEMNYKHKNLEEIKLDKILGGRNNIDYDTKYFLVKILLEQKLQSTIEELKNNMLKNYLSIKEIYRAKDDNTKDSIN